MTDRAPDRQHDDDPSALHSDQNLDVGSAAGSELPGVLAEPTADDADTGSGITGPAADSTLGSSATGVDNLEGGSSSQTTGGGTTGFGSGSGSSGVGS